MLTSRDVSVCVSGVCRRPLRVILLFACAALALLHATAVNHATTPTGLHTFSLAPHTTTIHALHAPEDGFAGMFCPAACCAARCPTCRCRAPRDAGNPPRGLQRPRNARQRHRCWCAALGAPPGAGRRAPPAPAAAAGRSFHVCSSATAERAAPAGHGFVTPSRHTLRRAPLCAGLVSLLVTALFGLFHLRAGSFSGIAKCAIIHPIQAFNCDGWGGSDTIIAGLNWVLQQTVRRATRG